MSPITRILPFFFFMLLDVIQPNIFSKFREITVTKIYCNNFFLPTKLRDPVLGSVYGQPFFSETLPKVLSHFDFESNKPSKPFVLRFNGPSGVGKTFVAEKFLQSDFFAKKYFFSATTHFPSRIPELLVQYKEELRKEIESSVMLCKRSLFVFDDVNTMPPNFFEDLPPFKVSPHLELNLKESLFIYVSQSDSPAIISATAEILKGSKVREDFQLKEFMNIFKNSGGFGLGAIKTYITSFTDFWTKEVEHNNLVDLYVPFLPLETEHVTKCILTEAAANGLTMRSNVLEEVLSSVECKTGNLCPYGCKMVHSKLFIALNKHDEL